MKIETHQIQLGGANSSTSVSHKLGPDVIAQVTDAAGSVVGIDIKISPGTVTVSGSLGVVFSGRLTIVG